MSCHHGSLRIARKPVVLVFPEFSSLPNSGRPKFVFLSNLTPADNTTFLYESLNSYFIIYWCLKGEAAAEQRSSTSRHVHKLLPLDVPLSTKIHQIQFQLGKLTALPQDPKWHAPLKIPSHCGPLNLKSVPTSLLPHTLIIRHSRKNYVIYPRDVITWCTLMNIHIQIWRKVSCFGSQSPVAIKY